MSQPTNEPAHRPATATSGADGDTLRVTLLAQGEQSALDIARQLARFIAAARQSLDLAIYDFRLSGQPAELVAAALRERAAAGVAIRIAYDADKPSHPHPLRGMDPAPSGTGAFVGALGHPARRIGGLKLMHHKYLVRDAALPSAAVWTGSANFTLDSWTLQENNILEISSAALAGAYARDFAELWRRGDIAETGDFVPHTSEAVFAGAPATIHAHFAPGCGAAINDEVARLVAGARRRVLICSMLLNAGPLIGALRDLARAGQVAVSGVYDRTQMLGVLEQWQSVPHNHWKIGALAEIVARAGLVGKHSTPFTPNSPHDFLHCKTLVVDDMVITGSYNFSNSAELNAENILMIESAALAETYSRFIAHLARKYAGGPQGLSLPANADSGTEDGGTSYGGPSA
ncbi:MAG TPA: phosphatidylserine/phosphatidylglycerophosphate/cardiolipin synthase family protein [Ktedonobacterales bacterium]